MSRTHPPKEGAPAPQTASPASVDTPPAARRPTRTLVIIALVALAFLALGVGLGRLVKSPAQVAAEAAPPAAGPVTVPVELRTLTTQVTVRADVAYDDPTEIKIAAAGENPAIVTGRVPDVGQMVGAGEVVLEVAGRPVILLPGELPAYRTIQAGSSGPDVLQLKAALASLGFDPGDVNSDRYDAATATAVVALYTAAGYPAPAVDPGASANLESAREQVNAAQQGVTAAQQALTAASAGPSNSERLQQDAAVASAQRVVDTAQAEAAACEADCRPLTDALADAQDQLAIAQAQRAEARATPDTSGEQQVLAEARTALSATQQALSEAEAAAIVPLPVGEVAFAPSLPRRVDEVWAMRGHVLDGTALILSGATLSMSAKVTPTDAALLTPGEVGTVTLSDGSTLEVTVGEQNAAPSSDGKDDGADGNAGGGQPTAERITVEFILPDLTESQLGELQGSNVKVVIPLDSTGGDVLAVPLAALSAGPGGQARVEVLSSAGERTMIDVTTGLTANGYAEIRPVTTGSLAEGDLVTVGENGSVAHQADDSSDEPATADDAEGE